MNLVFILLIVITFNELINISIYLTYCYYFNELINISINRHIVIILMS